MSRVGIAPHSPVLTVYVVVSYARADANPQLQHKPTTRLVGLSMAWAGALNGAAMLCDNEDCKKKMLLANAGALAGGCDECPAHLPGL